MSDSLPLRMALLNMRSVVNKTFILHDFFISQELDFMFMTETWTKVRDFRGNLFRKTVHILAFHAHLNAVEDWQLFLKIAFIVALFLQIPTRVLRFNYS